MYSKREVRILFAVLLIFVFSLNSGFVYDAQSSSADWILIPFFFSDSPILR
jgi:hypothetical protein